VHALVLWGTLLFYMFIPLRSLPNTTNFCIFIFSYWSPFDMFPRLHDVYVTLYVHNYKNVVLILIYLVRPMMIRIDA
jgi:hypothetical protein